MGRKKNTNRIDVPASRKFLFEVYGLKTKVMTPYHLRIIHEEFKGIFDWYHTSGKLLCNTRDQNDDDMYKNIGICLNDEDTAITIVKHVQKKIEKNRNRYYWNKGEKIEQRKTLKKFIDKIHESNSKNDGILPPISPPQDGNDRVHANVEIRW